MCHVYTTVHNRDTFFITWLVKSHRLWEIIVFFFIAMHLGNQLFLLKHRLSSFWRVSEKHKELQLPFRTSKLQSWLNAIQLFFLYLRTVASSWDPGPSTASWYRSLHHSHGAFFQVSSAHRVSSHVTPVRALWSHCTLGPQNRRSVVQCRSTQPYNSFIHWFNTPCLPVMWN